LNTAFQRHYLLFNRKTSGEEFMKNILVAIPSSHPGGLDSALGAHFGHCDLYTLVEIAEGQVQNVRILPNVPHEQGGCMAPVNHLAQNGVQVLIAGGMGMRPLMGFNQVGIDVLHGGNAQTVGDALKGFLSGGLQRFTNEFTCGGGH
jgi:predicted Fe-Mo cluster-binding NifX family protein